MHDRLRFPVNTILTELYLKETTKMKKSYYIPVRFSEEEYQIL